MSQIEPTLAYLICPVRNLNPTQRGQIEHYVEKLEREQNYKFHCPFRDVDQSNDDGGVRICREHRAAMAECDEVHVWLNRPGSEDDWSHTCLACGKPRASEHTTRGMCECPLLSEGSVFDLGMAYMMQEFIVGGRTDLYWKPLKIVIANGPLSPTSEKSFLNVLLAMQGESDARRYQAE